MNKIMKKWMACLVVLMMTGSAWATLIFSEDFEATAVGAIPADWGRNNASLVYVTNNAAYSGSQSVRLFGTSADAAVPLLSKALATSESEIRIEWYSQINRTDADSYVYLRDSSNARLLGVRFSPTAVFSYWSGTTVESWTPTTAGITASTWYKLRLDVDYSNNSWDFYVDDVAVATGLQFNPNATATSEAGSILFAGAQFAKKAGGVGTYLDQVSVSVIPEPTTLSLVVISGGVLVTLLRRRNRLM